VTMLACRKSRRPSIAWPRSVWRSIKNETPKMTLGDMGAGMALPSPNPATETKPYLRNAAVSRGFARYAYVRWWRPDWLAGHVGLELRNVDANYPFKRSHRFAGIQPNSGFGDYSRLSCGVGHMQLGRRPGSRQGCLRGRHQPSSRGLPGSEPNCTSPFFCHLAMEQRGEG
jgi:hypothetical protein